MRVALSLTLGLLLGCSSAGGSDVGAGASPSTEEPGGIGGSDPADDAPEGGADADVDPDGSWAHPFVIDELPAVVTGDTTEGFSSEASAYRPCAPDTPQLGPEVVYRLEVAEAGWLSARVDDVPGDAIDVDVHLLGAADPDFCITRHDVWLGAPVWPGTYWIAVDTYSDASYAGAYSLEVELVTEAGNDCLTSSIACDGMLPPFVNLDVAEEPGDDGCLPGMARVEDFCIDRYEAMVLALDGDDWVPVSPYGHPDDSATLVALSVADAVPQGHISQVQAADACLMAGKRLCDDAEWLRACQGSSGTTYPYGDSLEPGRCNDARACHPVLQYFETTDDWVWSELDHPCISQLPEGLATTGSYAGCVSSEGAFDLMGNLHEWTSDPAGTFRGGFYVDTEINGSGCSYATTAHSVAHHDYSTGFRCCADAAF
jgi:hypothetical protein